MESSAIGWFRYQLPVNHRAVHPENKARPAIHEPDKFQVSQSHNIFALAEIIYTLKAAGQRLGAGSLKQSYQQPAA
jgi:hypothetical protein